MASPRSPVQASFDVVPAAPAAGGPIGGRGLRARHVVREIVVVAALLGAYKVARVVTRGDLDTALANARQVMDVERSLGILTEAALQRAVLSSRGLVEFLNAYYLVAHFAVTIAFAVWLFASRPVHYRRFRRILITVTTIALVAQVLYPLAPPRMLAGFVDTGARFGPSSYGAGGAFEGMANEIAAMPSMHFGWAVLVAWGFVRWSSARARLLVVAHPVLTLAAIVLTANHYWLDAIVACAFVVTVIGVEDVARRRARRGPNGPHEPDATLETPQTLGGLVTEPACRP